MAQLWNILLYHPLVNALVFLAKYTGDLGWSIIWLTIGLRLIMTPLVIPSLKSGKKMAELAPELEKLKKEFKDNKQGLVTAQAELYKKHGLNPAAGCLPQIVQIAVLIALFNAFNTVLKPNGTDLVTNLNPLLYSSNQLPQDFALSTKFYNWDLAKPDTFSWPGLPVALPGILLVATAVVQFFSSKMMMPQAKKQEKLAEKTAGTTDDMMAATQQQMLYMFPVMTLIFGYTFPTGLVIYWLVFSLVSSVQQYTVSGWGGLRPWLIRAGLLKS
ncbi:MAG: YidC/Oxa1 family membrane protein insertase [bacterium]|nr:YidC/Oxa1 family membrane protein insertase [bacterium]